MAKKSKEEVSNDKGLVEKDGDFYLRPHDLFRLELAQQVLENKKQAVDIARLRIVNLQAKYEADLACLRAEEGQCVLRMRASEDLVVAICAELRDECGVDLATTTYDSKTGKLIRHSGG